MIEISKLPGLSRRWQITVYICIGILAGLGLFVGKIANAISYLSNAPETCMNCHVMIGAYATWQRGSHGKVAVCVDCHVPHDNPVARLAFKAADGMKHSYAFTMRNEPQVLRLSETARPVVQENCLRCHSNQFTMTRLAASAERKCWDCHSNIHGETRSLSSSPHVLRPKVPNAGLEWMK